MRYDCKRRVDLTKFNSPSSCPYFAPWARRHSLAQALLAHMLCWRPRTVGRKRGPGLFNTGKTHTQYDTGMPTTNGALRWQCGDGIVHGNAARRQRGRAEWHETHVLDEWPPDQKPPAEGVLSQSLSLRRRLHTCGRRAVTISATRCAQGAGGVNKNRLQQEQAMGKPERTRAHAHAALQRNYENSVDVVGICPGVRRQNLPHQRSTVLLAVFRHADCTRTHVVGHSWDTGNRKKSTNHLDRYAGP